MTKRKSISCIDSLKDQKLITIIIQRAVTKWKIDDNRWRENYEKIDQVKCELRIVCHPHIGINESTKCQQPSTAG